MKKIIYIIGACLLMIAGCSKEGGNDPIENPQNFKFKSFQSGIHDGFYWSLWTDDQAGYVNYQNGPKGNYSVAWDYKGNFTCGKGWSYGKPTRKLGYNCGAFTMSGGGTFGYYGWTKNPLIEYYVNEKWGSTRPTGEYKGTFWTDGAQYDIYTAMRYNAPSIIGTATFRQIFSTRKTQAPTGQNMTITFGNHCYAWNQVGLTQGTDWSPAAILLTEGYGGNAKGYVNATVWLISE